MSYKNRFGITISADLYLPKDFDESREHAAIVVGAPYGGVKEQGPGIYAQNLALRGFVALAFDPSFNGYSGGEPRHVSSPDIFVEDFSAAVDYLGTRPFVSRERIGVLGMCGSGGFALSAAQVDRRIKAVATVSMYDISGAQSCGFGDSFTEEDRNRILDAIAEQRYAEFEGGAPVLTPRGEPIGFDATTDPIGREFLTHIESISPRPILFIVGDHAHSRYFSEDAYELAAEPKELYTVPNAGHVDLYDKTDLIPFDKLDEFFTENLASASNDAVGELVGSKA